MCYVPCALLKEHTGGVWQLKCKGLKQRSLGAGIVVDTWKQRGMAHCALISCTKQWLTGFYLQCLLLGNGRSLEYGI